MSQIKVNGVIFVAVVQMVTFGLSGEEYGIDINCINGIIKTKNYKIFKIPNSPNYLEGIINLRGKANLIFNLKKKFHFPDEPLSEDSKIVIVNMNDATVGFVVDDVTDIFKLNDEEIESFPTGLKGNEKGYITSIGKVDDRMILILDLVKVLTEDDLEQIQSVNIDK